MPDFQHLRLPEFFPEREITGRNRAFAEILDYSSSIVLSSHDAQNDLREFYPQSLHKSRVLQFVSGDDKNVDYGAPERLVEKYGIGYPFFHLPNQFWIHKNHRIVIEALGVLRAQGLKTSVVATGNIADWRQPEHYKNLMKYAAELGVEDMFTVLGIVPYDDLLALMRHSIAIINPSLFEGWSSTVEEGKSIGKKILLSNIGVHREQAPERGVFFDPQDAADLAQKMQAAKIVFSAEEDSRFYEAARDRLQDRFAVLGAKYIAIVKDVVASEAKRGRAPSR
ncbi:MAG TPA: glycosyltransferase [Aliidongia sp.]|uniref:glycosyltransferase n=1 Tax=Aliidongia sp. TaxID=1914230 RepID=UPI002DDD9794|nr:glycosyltransferase [Aliidongia sp.]HEV2674621.1 glycosyltransferase [Aliidongia sp.]